MYPGLQDGQKIIQLGGVSRRKGVKCRKYKFFVVVVVVKMGMRFNSDMLSSNTEPITQIRKYIQKDPLTGIGIFNSPNRKCEVCKDVTHNCSKFYACITNTTHT